MKKRSSYNNMVYIYNGREIEGQTSYKNNDTKLQHMKFNNK